MTADSRLSQQSSDARTRLAYERTYAAWLRTGLAALGGGLAARALLDRQLPKWLVELTSISLIAMSVLLFVIALSCEPADEQQLRRPFLGLPQPPVRFVGIILSLLAAASLLGVILA